MCAAIRQTREHLGMVYTGGARVQLDTEVMPLLTVERIVVTIGLRTHTRAQPYSLHIIGNRHRPVPQERGVGVEIRSSTLDAMSFEGSPYNPFISNFDTPRSYLQKQGHGALVDTPSGEWYYASLCARPWHHENESVTDPRGWCTLGRETSIQKVEWTDLDVELGKRDAIEGMVIFTEIPSLLDEVLAPVIVMEQACIEANAVDPDRFAPRATDVLGGHEGSETPITSRIPHSNGGLAYVCMSRRTWCTGVCCRAR